jgi:hypothetical protein
MDWYKKYRVRKEKDTYLWDKNFAFFDRRLDDAEFKIECNITEEEFLDTSGKCINLYYGDDFENLWHLNKACVVLDVVRIRKEKLNKLNGLV